MGSFKYKGGLRQYFKGQQPAIGKQVLDNYNRGSMDKMLRKSTMKRPKPIDFGEINNEYYKFARYQKQEQDAIIDQQIGQIRAALSLNNLENRPSVLQPREARQNQGSLMTID